MPQLLHGRVKVQDDEPGTWVEGVDALDSAQQECVVDLDERLHVGVSAVIVTVVSQRTAIDVVHVGHHDVAQPHVVEALQISLDAVHDALDVDVVLGMRLPLELDPLERQVVAQRHGDDGEGVQKLLPGVDVRVKQTVEVVYLVTQAGGVVRKQDPRSSHSEVDTGGEVRTFGVLVWRWVDGEAQHVLCNHVT